MSNKKNKANVDILDELVNRQLKDVPTEWKLQYSDMDRICRYIDKSIFDDECCLWSGYITNANNLEKGTYINFYFRNKKVALHRLLYSNFVAPLDSSEYLKFNCENKGICCNVKHYEKYKYSKTVAPNRKQVTKENKKVTSNIIIIEANSDDDEIVFDS